MIDNIEMNLDLKRLLWRYRLSLNSKVDLKRICRMICLEYKQLFMI